MHDIDFIHTHVTSLWIIPPEHQIDQQFLDPTLNMRNALDKAMGLNVMTPEFYPQILWEFTMTRFEFAAINPEFMNNINEYLASAGIKHKCNIKQAWVYFWQILCYTFFIGGSANGANGFIRGTWYNNMKLAAQQGNWDMDELLYKLVLKSYEFDATMDIQFVIDIWVDLNQRMEPDSEIYQIIFGIIDKQEKLGLYNNLLDSIIYDVIYKCQPIMDKNLVNKIFQTQYSNHLSLNQFYALYIGCDISEDTTCTNILDSTMVRIPEIVKQVSTQLQQMNDLAYQEAILYTNSISERLDMRAVRAKVPDNKHLSQLLKDHDMNPLIIGVTLEHHRKQTHTFTDFKPIIEHYINRLTSNTHYKDPGYKDRILQSWAFFFNPEVLKLLEPVHAFRMLQKMKEAIDPTVMMYNCVLSRILDDDIKEINLNLLSNIYKYGMENFEFDEVTFGLWFTYLININFGHISPTESIASTWAYEVMTLFFQKKLNITPKIYRQVVIIWIKYDLDFAFILRLNRLRF